MRASSSTQLRISNRSSKLVMGFVILLLAVNMAQVVYRLIQPTDGWVLTTEPTNTPFRDNALGAESPILPGDNLIEIEGLKIADLNNQVHFGDLRPPGWLAGGTITYRVLRDGKELDLEVPLYNWTMGAILGTLVTPFTLISFLLFGLGGFVFSRQPLDWGARALFLFSTSLFVAGMSGMSQAVDILLPTWPLTAFLSFLIWGWLMLPSFLALALSFPRPKRFVQKHPGWTFLGIYGTTPVLSLATGDLGIGWFTVIGFAVISLVAVVHTTVTTKDAIGRAQIRWAGAGVVLGAIAFTLNNIFATYYAFIDPNSGSDPGFLAELPILAGFGSIALGFAIAILRYRLFDIDVLIRRTLVYSLLTALLALVYFGAVTLLQNLFQAVSGETSTAAIVISTLAIAALFNPLRKRLQELIDRRFYRQNYNAEQALAEFAAAARNETDLMSLTNDLSGAIQNTLQPTYTSIWIKSQASSTTELTKGAQR
jgi:hypothetical protein